MVFQNNLLMGSGGNQGEDYTIDYSCRYNDDDSPYLIRTFGTPTSSSQFGYSVWTKRSNLGYKYIISATDGSGDNDQIYFSAGNVLVIQEEGSNRLISDQVFRDPSAWYHFLFAYDLGNGTNAYKLRVYLNGEEITSWSTDTRSSYGSTSPLMNAAVQHTIGDHDNGPTAHIDFYDGYFAECNFVDGTVLTPAMFGETNSTTGQWIPKDTSSLAFGANGFHLDFAIAPGTAGGAGTDISRIETSTAMTSGMWHRDTGDWTFSGSDIAGTGADKVIWGPTFAGDFEVTMDVVDQGCFMPGFAIIANDFSSGYLDTSGRTDWYWKGDGTNSGIYSNNAGTAVLRQAADDDDLDGVALKITRTSGTFKWYKDGSLYFTDTSVTNTGIVQLVIQTTGTGSAVNVDNITFVSGLGNHFGESGLASTDQVVDTPTDNYCTLNPLDVVAYTLSDGNLVTNGVGDARAYGNVRFDVEDADGFYFEAKVTTAASYPNVAIRMAFNKNFGSTSAGRYNFIGSSGNFSQPSGTASYGTAWSGTADKVIGVLVKAGAIYFSIDGTVQNSGTAAATGLTGYAIPLVFYDAGGGTAAEWEMHFAANTWATTPTGYKAISTTNLPDPDVADPSAYFQTTLYTGNGSTQSIDQGGNKTFSPDFVWIKNRSAGDAHQLFDSTRGVTKVLISNDTDAEATDADTLTAFDSDGFSLGDDDKVNTNTESYVAWQWLEGSTPGFDVVSYTGDGSNRTISHSLGAVPGQMIIKNLDTAVGWAVYNEGSLWHGAANLGYLTLNTTAVSYDNDEYWNDTTPTSSVFTVGTNDSVNKDSSPMIAYLWAGVEGFSSFGHYEGNGSTDGPLILTGFKPRFIVCKSYSGVKGWNMFDSARSTYNVSGAQLQANLTDAEATLNAVDLLSNGFKLRTTDNAVNRNGYGFIYMAWAESPFKYATAR